MLVNNLLLVGILLTASHGTIRNAEAQTTSTTESSSTETTTGSSGSGPISSTDPDISDGACTFPTQLATKTDVLALYSPLRNYYIPLGSKALYRAEFEILKNRSANSEEEVAALKTRLQAFRLAALLRGADLRVTFFGGRKDWYGYSCLPSKPFNRTMGNILAPFLNVTCTVPSGSKGVASAKSVGKIYFSVIWSDNKGAAVVWGCIKNVQSFFVMNTKPTLTDTQRTDAIKAVTALGFKEANFQEMSYT